MDILLLLFALFLIATNNKQEWVLTIMLALCTNLFQASKFFSDFIFIPNMYDGALIITIALLINYWNRRPFLSKEYINFKKYISIFALYIGLIIIIDILLNNISIISVIKTSRHWLFLLNILIIPKIPIKVLNKTLYIVLNITIIISVIIGFEFFTGNYYFTEIHYENGVARGALPSTFAVFYTFLLACNYFNMNNRRRYTYIFILVLSLLASSTRSISLATFLGYAICIYFCSHNKSKSLFQLFIFSIVALAIVLVTPGLNERFTQLNEEIVTSKYSNDIEGNTTYRLYHFAERYEYIRQNPQHYLFGIGNVVEENFPYIFQAGLYNEEMQRPTQLNTGDITWSVTILRLGIVGTILFIVLALCISKSYIKHIPNKLAVASFAYIITTFTIISFAGTSCYRGSFWIIPTLCMCIIGYNHHNITTKNYE